jgi:hypothetical protein
MTNFIGGLVLMMLLMRFVIIPMLDFICDGIAAKD